MNFTQNDLPPKKWTQRRVGDSMKANSKPGGVQCKGKTSKRSVLTEILKFQRSKWSRMAATKFQRWQEAWESMPIRFITGRGSLSDSGEKAFPGKGHLTEIAALRRKLRDVEMERDILKKAVGIFSKTTENGLDS